LTDEFEHDSPWTDSVVAKMWTRLEQPFRTRQEFIVSFDNVKRSAFFFLIFVVLFGCSKKNGTEAPKTAIRELPKVRSASALWIGMGPKNCL